MKVLQPQQVQYRCSFVLEVGAEVRPGTFEVALRGTRFVISLCPDDSLRGAGTFPDGTTGTLFLGRDSGYGKRPVLLATRTAAQTDGSFNAKSFAGEVLLQPLGASILPSAIPDADDPDLTTRTRAVG